MNIPSGTFSRWSFGIIVLTHLTAYNECGSVCVLVAAGLAMLNSLLMVHSKNGLNQIQMPYLRASQRVDFVCLFLAVWMELLGLIAQNAAIIRTISYCLDAMSGGLVRIYILGRSAISSGETWPDVLGVVIVFLISFMFIMGLENSKIFTVLMIMGVLSISLLLAIVTYVRGNVETWLHENLFPKGMQGILSAAGLLLVSFPNSLPTGGRYSKIKVILLSGSILLSILLTAGCLSTLITTSLHEYETVPILQILEAKDYHKLIPAISCLYIIASSGILLEMFPEAYQIVVKLASSEWKILLKQIGYENRDTGSPALAVFVCGSLICILTFACPLQNLTYIIAGAQLFHGSFIAFYFLYSPHRPKIVATKQDTTLAYSRLNTGTSISSKPVGPKRSASSWLPSLNSQSFSKSITKLNNKNSKKKEEEREWLLLGEPSSPVVRQFQENTNAESSILSDTTTSDIDCIMKNEQQLDSETSEDEEDIDTIVEEFQQKLKISTIGLKESTLKIPSQSSWQFCLFIIVLVIGVSILAGYGANNQSLLTLLISFIVILILGFITIWIPKYYPTHATPSSFICIISLFFNSILISSIMFDSMLAIIFWLFSGVILVLQSLIKCDVLCCLCLDYPRNSAQTTIVMEEHLIPNGSSNRMATTSIHIKNPPKGLSVVNHVQKYR